MSRLLESTESLRNQLESRNLYNFNNSYTIDDLNNAQTLTNTINSISNIINPFSTSDFGNSLLGRIVLPNTPIQQIGTAMLAQQFSYTTKSNAATEFLPKINLKSIISKDTKLFEFKIDYQITRRDGGFLTKLGNLVERLTGNYPDTSPFSPTSTNADYIRNTGKGQLSNLSENISRNLYKISDRETQSVMSEKGLPVTINREYIFNKNWIPTDEDLFPDQYFTNVLYRNSMFSYYVNVDGELRYLEYNNKKSYKDSFGITRPIRQENDLNSENYGFINDNDIYTYGFLNSVNKADVVFDDEVNTRFALKTDPVKFKIENGLLKYTAALVEGSQGRFMNLANKNFYDHVDGFKFVGLNGSGIYRIPSDNANPINNKLYNGIRQHTVFDPYNSYIKAIRFNGNKIYQGNDNSVINESVIPRIHPTQDDRGVVNSKNLVFSIENLAVNVIPDEDLGIAYLDDEYATVLPISEYGQLGGRLMWFPPYDVKLTETSIAKHDTTTFIGRSEPVYTYNNTERIATLSFKLLIDYPPNLLGYNRSSDDFHQKASEFFLFGGASGDYYGNLAELQKQLIDKINQNEPIEEKEQEDNVQVPPDFNIYFINDSSSIDDILLRNYQIEGLNTANWANGEINNQFYQIIDGGGGGDLYNFFIDNSDNLSKYKINLVGRASFAGTAEDNQTLSQNRINSTKAFLRGLISKDLKFAEESALGSEGTTETDDLINDNAAIQARRVEVSIVRAESNVESSGGDLDTDDINAKGTLDQEIADLKRKMNIYRTSIFNNHKIEDGSMSGFQSIKEDKFRAGFHSMTPEDFHRRLTFLQQCVRQGKPAQSDSGLSASNSAFGKQPVQILRIGDFFHTKIIIDNIDFDYIESNWDLNPEGMGMQPMIADISIQMRVIGGQSLQTPIATLQNATSFNYYANSTYYNTNTYTTPTIEENSQLSENFDIVSQQSQRNSEVLEEKRLWNGIIINEKNKNKQ
jgi:hypothetical protein